MDISLDGGENHAAAGFPHGAAHLFPDFLKGSLGGFRRHQQLGKIDRLLFKSLPYRIQGRYNAGIDNFQRFLFGKLLLRGLRCRFLHTPLHRFLQGEDGFAFHRHRRWLVIGTGLNVVCEVLIFFQQCKRTAEGVHHHFVIGIDDRRRKSALQCHGKECRVDPFPHRQAEGDV